MVSPRKVMAMLPLAIEDTKTRLLLGDGGDHRPPGKAGVRFPKGNFKSLFWACGSIWFGRTVQRAGRGVQKGRAFPSHPFPGI